MKMSEPVTNVEIEDVLSSIRKLVSNRPKAETQQDAPTPTDEDRLVLTPALRVDEDDESHQDHSHHDHSHDDRHDDPDRPSADTPELTGDAQAAQDAQDAQAAPQDQDLPQDAASDPDAAAEDPPAEDRETAADEVCHDHATPDSDQADDWQDSAPDPAPQAEGDAKDDMEAGGEAAAPAPETAEPSIDQILASVEAAEDAPEDTASEAQRPIDDDQDDTAAQAQAADQADDAHDAPEGQAPDPGAQRAPSALEARVAGFEAVVNSRQEQWEPDGTTDDAYSGSDVGALPWEDHMPEPEDTSGAEYGYDSDAEGSDFADIPEAERVEEVFAEELEADDDPAQADDHMPEPDPTPEPAAMAAAFDATPSEDDLAQIAEEAVLDEDMLRDMVAEIVRQELQGSLGERITRNVRKLVRREIHRALASQDFE